MNKAIVKTIASIFPPWQKFDPQHKSDFLSQVQLVNLSKSQFIWV